MNVIKTMSLNVFGIAIGLNLEAASLSEIISLYNVYQGATELGDYGFTIEFDKILKYQFKQFLK